MCLVVQLEANNPILQRWKVLSNPMAVCCCLCTLCDLWLPVLLTVGHSVSRAQVLQSLWDAKKHQQALDSLIPLMLFCSPGADEARIRAGAKFNPDGSLREWYMPYCKLTVLPEEFGMVRTTGRLALNSCGLRSLPESFGSVTVGEDLYLLGNQLESLPESFGEITVGRDLMLTHGGDIGPAMAVAGTPQNTGISCV